MQRKPSTVQQESEPYRKQRSPQLLSQPVAGRLGQAVCSSCFIACQDFGPQGRDLRPGTLTMMNSLSSASVGLRPEFGKLLSHPIMSRFAAMR